LRYAPAWWSPLRASRNARHASDGAAVCRRFALPTANTTHNATHKTSPAYAQGHAAGEQPSRPATETLLPRVPSVRRLGEFFPSRRQATPDKSHGLASDEREVSVFHPVEVEQALDRNMDAIARLVEATRRPQLDAELRDILLLAASDVRIANQRLSKLLDACPLCGEPGLKRVCRGCGARKGKP
jgi:hypothetical protein